MNTEKFDELNKTASSELANKFQAMKEHAEHVINQHAKQMIESGDAYELSDDEERLIKAYRQFVARSKPESIFKWRTPADIGIVVPSEPCLIQDPRDVSADN